MINKWKTKHKGVVGFEYVIILTIMSTALYGTYNTLSSSLKNKGQDISEFIDNNGQIPIKGESSNSNANNVSKDKDKQKDDDNAPIYWTQIDYNYYQFCEKSIFTDSNNESYFGNDAYDMHISNITLDNLINYMERKHIDTIYGFGTNEVSSIYSPWGEHAHVSSVILYKNDNYPFGYNFYFQNPAYTTSKPIKGLKPMTLDKLKEYAKTYNE